MSQEFRSYYAIIPANVRYDKDLTPNAKLLYGEITALCNEKGYCWASNSYFSELYGTSIRSISKWINQLIEKNYIYSKIIYKDGTKEIEKRHLYLGTVPIEENFHTPRRKVPECIEENFHTPIEEKFQDNNTSFNNTFNNTSLVEQTEKIIKYLNQKTGKDFRNTKANQKLIKALLKDVYKLEDIQKVIDIKVQEWGNSEREKYLRPQTLFEPTKFESYLNQKNIEIDNSRFKSLGKLSSELTESEIEEFLLNQDNMERDD